MKKLDFNQGWRFYKKGCEAAAQTVALPHDAMLHEARDPACKNGKNTGYYPGGSYVYEKELPAIESEALLIEFEGVYHNATLFVNDEPVYAHPNGYTSFLVDLTQHLCPGQPARLRLAVDALGEPSSRWYPGSGIYRPVWLHVGKAAHILPDGVRITTLSHCPPRVRVTTQATAGEVEVTLWDQGKPIASATGTDVELELPGARLWSAEQPNLYECQVRLTQNGHLADEICLPFGVCHIEHNTRGLFINGCETKLRGACVHHDNGVLGACEFPAAARRRVRILKEAGFNALRSAHNPCSKALLVACDELGLYVMDEFTDMWYEHKTRWDYAGSFEEWHECDLIAMVKKDWAHPSVILYSIGNEVTETAEPWGIRLTGEMAALVRRLDPARPVTCGINMALNVMHFAGMGVYRPEVDEPAREPQPKNPKALALLMEQMKQSGSGDKARQQQMAAMQSQGGEKQEGKLVGSEYFNQTMLTMKEQQRQVVTTPVAKLLSEDAFAALDIAGYNYADGRYYLDGEEYPQRVSVGSETLPQRIYKNWQAVTALPYLIGDFMWTGWDYIGEAGIGAFCYDSVGTKDKAYPALLAGSGVIDILGHPRPEVWLNKAVFGLSALPYIGVEPVTRSHENRLISAWRYSDAVHSWAWAGCEGKKAEVIVYCAAPQVELLLNGRSLGTRPTEECQAKFETQYEPGELTAIGYDDAGRETGRDTLYSAADETRLTLCAHKPTLYANGQDLCYVEIELTDEQGIVKASADLPVQLALTGAGTLAGFGSADPFNSEPYTGTLHSTYYGRALAVVRAGCEAGAITLTATAPGCAPQTITLQVVCK